MKEKFAKLIDVKSIVTLMVMGVFCALAVKGIIKADAFTNIAIMITTYFFTKKSTQTSVEPKDKNDLGVEK